MRKLFSSKKTPETLDVEKLQSIKMGPGDVLAIIVNGNIRPSHGREYAKMVEEFLYCSGFENRVMVFPQGTTLKVIEQKTA